MNLVNRLQTHYGWTSSYRLVSKKPVPPGLETFQVPQTTGILGWIVLSHENNIPVCTWITARECYTIPVCLDERLFSDTIFRAEKLGNTFILSDVWIYNGTCVFALTSFKQRYDWIQQMLARFHKTAKGLVRMMHKSEVTDMKLRGYEVYTHEEGAHGCFIEQDLVTVLKTDLPDVFTVQNREGYLRIPNLATSQYMRSKVFPCSMKCIIRDDGSWDIAENIPSS